MTHYEYKILPAPTRGLKAKGLKSPEARFANAIETEVNALAEQGWEYLRADTLPHEERQGLTGSATTFRTLLVFRRVLAGTEDGIVEAGPPEADLVARTPEPEPNDSGGGTRDTDSVVLTPEVFAATLQKDDDTPRG